MGREKVKELPGWRDSNRKKEKKERKRKLVWCGKILFITKNKENNLPKKFLTERIPKPPRGEKKLVECDPRAMQSRSDHNFTIDDIPLELICNVFFFLQEKDSSPTSLLTVSLVCRNWLKITSNEQLWKHRCFKWTVGPYQPAARDFTNVVKILSLHGKHLTSLCLQASTKASGQFPPDSTWTTLSPLLAKLPLKELSLSYFRFPQGPLSLDLPELETLVLYKIITTNGFSLGGGKKKKARLRKLKKREMQKMQKEKKK